MKASLSFIFFEQPRLRLKITGSYIRKRVCLDKFLSGWFIFIFYRIFLLGDLRFSDVCTICDTVLSNCIFIVAKCFQIKVVRSSTLGFGFQNHLLVERNFFFCLVRWYVEIQLYNSFLQEFFILYTLHFSINIDI